MTATRIRFIVILVALTVAASIGRATTTSLAEIGIDQHPGAQVPLDVLVSDESGRVVPLRSFFHSRPVLLALVYYKCPMLCTLSLNQLTRSLNVLSETPGQQFDIVTLSFNADETPALATSKKAACLKSYRRAGADEGWHFLTAPQASVDAVTSSVGFHVRRDPDQPDLIGHSAGLIVLTPDGKVSRYLLGVDYPPTEMRAAIQQAGRGEIGPESPQVFLYCLRYDPATGRYGVIIWRALNVLGALTLIGLVALIGALAIRARRSPAPELAKT